MSYRNQSTDLLCQSIQWFVYDPDIEVKWIREASRMSMGD